VAACGRCGSHLALTASVALSTTAKADCVATSERYQEPFGNPNVEVSVDAKPWFVRSCEPVSEGCGLFVDLELKTPIDATVEVHGCDEPPSLGISQITPHEQLVAGQVYFFGCENSEEGAALVVRDDELPAMAPPTFDTAHVQLRRSRNICEGRELELDVDFSTYPAEFFAEGGRAEVEYSDKAIYIPDLTIEPWILPYTEDDITITLVATNGVRGEPLTVSGEEFAPAGISCAIDVTGKKSAPWLLVPFFWVFWGRRGRREVV